VKLFDMTLFETFPASSRVWIYQAPRPLTIEEREVTSALLEDFMEVWAAHGTKLKCDYTILYKRFVVLVVDEGVQPATGCSIDDSVGEIKKISEAINVDLFDRMNVAFVSDNGLVVSASMADFEEMANNGDIDENTTVFNNMLTTLGEVREKWEGPVKDSWQSRYLKSAPSA
jgi:hypothetical protein